MELRPEPAPPETEMPFPVETHEEDPSERETTTFTSPVASMPQRAEPPRQPAAPANVRGAIDEVNHVIEKLRESLDDMEEVLETLELAERQKDADEHEIDSLRRALRQVNRPRENPQQRPHH